MKKFCHHCGNQVILGAKFCGNCGTSLSSLSASPPSAQKAPPATFTPFSVNREDDEEAVDRLTTISHLGITSLAVDIVKDRPLGEKLGEALASPINPQDIPANRPAIYKSNDECREDFKKEAGSLVNKNRVASVEIKG